MRESIRLEGTIEKVSFRNEENGYTICSIVTEDGESVTLTGILPQIKDGERMVVIGYWTEHPKYGKQLCIQQAEVTLPTTKRAIREYLSSKAFKGIGPKTAQKIVERFGENTFDVIEEHPDWLTDCGVSRSLVETIKESYKQNVGMRNTFLFFQEDYSPEMIHRIYKTFGEKSVELIRENPYRLCQQINGIGFARADKTAQKLGFEANAPFRIRAGILHFLTEIITQNGHTCYPREETVKGVAELLALSEEAVTETLNDLTKKGELVTAKVGNTPMLFSRHFYKSEKEIADKLIVLQKLSTPIDSKNQLGFLERAESEGRIRYTAQQKEAILAGMQNGVLVITGGPGTGKTTIVRALLSIFKAMQFKVALSAPTGRAGMRLSESTNEPAKTLHRLLEYSENTTGVPQFNKNERDLLEENVIIVDEMSMVDTQLMLALLRATRKGSRLIFIGDSDQLPSVGAGNVLHDLLDSGVIPTVRLTEIFRQAKESLIITNAHAILKGEMPNLSCKNRDFFFLPVESEESIAGTVQDLCANRLPKAYGIIGREGTQVICPSKKGICGVENLNTLLQNVLNPKANRKKEYAHGGITFREGDRVMQIRNNYELVWECDGKEGHGVFNGDIGLLERIDTENRKFRIDFDGHRVEYEFSDLDDLTLSYCITVHKSQGSEYPIVVMPFGSVPPLLCFKNLLYTGVTRAQQMVIFVGKEKTIREMVNGQQKSRRFTGLSQWLKEGQ